MARPVGRVFLAFSACALTLLCGCATSSVGRGGGLLAPAGAADRADPWEIPAGAFPSQRLYRVKYRGPDGKAGFKLTLYLGSADHYRMAAADSLGRKLWSLEVDERGRAVWLNHRSKEFCRMDGAERLVVMPLANLPLVSLPKLLLGRIPGVPVAYLQRGERHVSYLDARGRKWTGVFEGGLLDWWSLEDGDETQAWWRREADGGNFSDPLGDQGASWREIVRETLTERLDPLEVPEKFEEGACDGGAGAGEG